MGRLAKSFVLVVAAGQKAVRRNLAAPWPWLWALLAAVAVHGLWHKTGADFRVFYRAATRLHAGAPTLYAADEALPFKYPPPAAILLAPLAWLPLGAARLAFALVSAAAVVDVTRLCCGAAMAPKHAWRTSALALAAVGLPLVQELSLGQCDAVLLWAAVQSEAIATRRPWASAALLAVAATLKPPFALTLLPALLAGAWPRLGRVAAAGASLGVGHAFCVGPGAALGEWQAWHQLLRATTEACLYLPDCQSLAAIGARWGAGPSNAPIAHGFLVAAGGAFFVALLHRGQRCTALAPEERRAWRSALCLAFTPLLSPLGWISNFIGLLPALVWGLGRHAGAKPWQARVVLPLVPLFAAELLNFETLGRTGYMRALAAGHVGLGAAAFLAIASWAWLRPQLASGARRLL